MPEFHPFVMERWQSTYENVVDYNLSESGVEPLTLHELLQLSGSDALLNTALGYGQSNGTEALRSRIAQLYGSTDIDGITVCNGSAEANFLAVWELVGPGDEVAILTPTYMQTHGLARTLGATVVDIPLREELGWQPDPDEVHRRITGRTRMVVVTNPGNPTGSILNDAARTAILERAQQTGAWILADEVYAGAELDGSRTPSFLGQHERVVATGSLSKAYGLPGLRIGWAATDPRTADALWARSDYTTISPGDLTDRLAAAALDDAVRPLLLDRTRAIIREGLDILTTWMVDVGGFHWHPPRAGAICFARYEADIESDTLAERLRSEQSVLIVPGSHFGLGNFIRFGLGVPQHLSPALDRVGAVLRQPAK